MNTALIPYVVWGHFGWQYVWPKQALNLSPPESKES